MIRMPSSPPPVARRRGINGGWSPTISDNTMLSIYDRVLGRYMPAGLLVDEQYNLIHTFGGAERFVRIPPGRPSTHVLDLLVPTLKTTVSGALQHAAKEKKLVKYAGIPLHGDGANERLRVQVEPFPEDRSNNASYLITFETMGEDPMQRPAEELVDLGRMSQDRIESLETELTFTKESLQSTIEELETSNEELQATNEELVASNEELQSTNEELHSVNEELYTVNAELQRKISELTETTADLDSVLQTTEVGVLFLDPDLRIRKFTQRIVDAFQLLPQDVGRPIEAFHHNLESSTFVEDVRKVLATGVPVEREVRATDGRWYYLRNLPYRQGGRLAGVVVTLLDVGALRTAEADSRLLSAIVESSADAIIATDTDGTITQWNRGAVRMYGWEAEEVLGRPMTVIVPDGKQAELRDISARVMRGENVEVLETVRRRKDGSTLYVSLQVSPIRGSRGDVVAVSSVDRDVSARRQAEEQTRNAVEQRERFLAILSHELRNPLAAVVSAARVLQTEIGDDLRVRALNVLKRQSGHMARLLDDLLDISRIRQGRIEIKKETMDLKQVLEAALETVSAVIDERKIHVEVKIDAEPLSAIGDPHRLRQLVVNLLTNSLRHSDPGKTVTLAAQKKGARAIIAVRDQGTGIPAELLPHVFEPFGLAHLKGSRAGGLGIGLWLVRSIAEAHGGTVSVQSRGDGLGSDFVVELPLTSEPVPSVVYTDAGSIEGKVLLVEDQKDIQELTEAILTAVGVQVVTADSAEEAIDLVEKHRPNVALVDIGLPGMSGLDLARRVREQVGPEALRLIAVTGFGQQSDREAVFDAGFDQHLIKPVDADVLLQTVRAEMAAVRKSS